MLKAVQAGQGKEKEGYTESQESFVFPRIKAYYPKYQK